jgi:hypothetical protein
MGIKVANNANATLAASINSSATSITVTSGQGARFPTLSAGDYFYATLIDVSNNLEIVKVTARSTDVLTVTRAQESTTGRAYSTGDRIELRLTAATFVDATTITSLEPAKVSDQANTSTGYFDLPSGTTAQRPASPDVGMIRYNSTTGYMEYYAASGWQTVAAPYSVDVLIVAGGGGGSWGTGSGGSGAGGLLYGSTSVNPQSTYSLVIGAGGSTTTANTIGNAGNNSTGFSATAYGGGVGSKNGTIGIAGGSGGGASGATVNGSDRAATAATQTSNGGFTGLGNAGGTSTGSSYYAGSGGGGAGAVGGNHSGGSGGTGGAGGAGYTWVNGTTYAGGGGGATENANGASSGGAGGGGNGGAGATNPTSGSANTGGGAGGNGLGGSGTNATGGSGVVIVRYLGSQKGSGGTVTSAGGYTYHTFTSSGTFTA